MLLQGMITLLKQDESARVSSKNGLVAWASEASCGIVGRRSLTRPRSSFFATSARSCLTNGLAVVERRVRGADAGQGLAGECAQRREGLVQLRQRRAALAERGVELGDRLLERLVLGRERAGDDPEVGDQVLQLLLVAVERLDRVAEVADRAGEVAGLGAEQRLVDLGREARAG